MDDGENAPANQGSAHVTRVADPPADGRSQGLEGNVRREEQTACVVHGIRLESQVGAEATRFGVPKVGSVELVEEVCQGDNGEDLGEKEGR